MITPSGKYLRFAGIAVFPVIFGLAFLLSLIAPHHESYRTDDFGKLPVLLNGRTQPLDSVARNSLIILSGKSRVATSNGKMSAIDWLIELSAQPELARKRKIFLLHNREIKGELGLDIEAKLFSYETLTQKSSRDGSDNNPIDIINSRAQAANDIEAKSRNAYQRDILRLFQQMLLYRGLSNSIRPENSIDFAVELEAYQALIPAGAEAFRLQQTNQPYDRDALDRLSRFAERYDRLKTISYFYVIPPETPSAGPEEWIKMGDALVLSISRGRVPHLAQLYAEALSSFRKSQVDVFNSKTEALLAALESARPEEFKRSLFEHSFNQIAPFRWAQIGYIMALLMSLGGLVLWRRPLRLSAIIVVYICFTIHSLGIVARMIIDGRPPVTNLYSSAVFIGWGTVLFAIILEHYSKRLMAMACACLVGFATLLVAHYLSLEGDTLEMMQAVLDSNFWLATHVLIITLGYSAMFVAGSLGIVWLVARLVLRDEKSQILKQFAAMIYGVVCFSLLFSFTGTVLGGIWADQSWGRFWGWDPKENGALLIVIWTAIILHGRLVGWFRARSIAALSVLGSIITAWSWFGTNMLGIGLHSYGFTDAASITLYSFVISQLFIFLLAFIPVKPKETANRES